MASREGYYIEVKILDSWTTDTYTSKGYILYSLVQIGDRLRLLERYLDDE